MERENTPESIEIQIAQRHFPEEVAEDILSRVPVDSLLRLRCVSKSWRSLIDSEKFIKFHLKKSTENQLLSHHRFVLAPVPSGERVLKMFSWSSLLEGPSDKPFEFDAGKHIGREVRVVAYCNGLVCLVQSRGRFILWNPATRMCLHLPDAPSRTVSEQPHFCNRMYGFGYVESSDDYKVLEIFTYFIRYRLVAIGGLYSLENHSWKELEEKDFPYVMNKAGMFVSENFHWFRDVESGPGILSFDLKNETFGMVEEPDYTGEPIQTIGVIEGCLSMLCNYRSRAEVWVMKQYGVKKSWVNLFAVRIFNLGTFRSLMVHSFFR